MAFRDYVAPGISVIVERQPAVETTALTQFYPVFIGTGMTSNSKTLTRSITTTGSNTSKTIEASFSGDVSSNMYTLTDATISAFRSAVNSSLSVNILSRLSTTNTSVTLDGTGNASFAYTFPATPTFKTTQVNGAVTNTATSIEVDDASIFYAETALTGTAVVDGGPASTINRQIIKIGTELLKVTAVNTTTNTLTVERGYGSTTAAAIANNATVTALPTVSLPSAAVTAVQTSFTIQNGTTGRFAIGQLLRLHKAVAGSTPEQVLITEINATTNTLTVIRGVNGTTPIEATSSHSVQFHMENPSDDFAAASKTSFSVDFTISNSQDDFEPLLVLNTDQYEAKDIFGPYFLSENGNVIRNDVAIAAQIAFRSGVDAFYYLEVPRTYGDAATSSDIVQSLEKVYYKKNIYRIVPLMSNTSANNLGVQLRDFIESVSNQLDKRETVGFITHDVSLLEFGVTTTNTKSMILNSLLTSVGSLSETINSSRVCNVFGAKSLSMLLDDSIVDNLPNFFLSVAVASLDASLPTALPLSLREIGVFTKAVTPRFRPAEWNQLAEKRVFIVYQDAATDPFTIRHQLTTSQSDQAEEQEYSIVKNVDAVTKLLRDRLSAYVGRQNVSDGLIEKLDASLAIAISEAKETGLCRDIQVLSPWTFRTYNEGSVTEERRNLVTRLKFTPSYPANNLDIYLVI